MKKNFKLLTIGFLIVLMFFSSLSVFAAGKRVIAENKYIWVYVDGERKLIADSDGYPCFGQGLDNKNVLYMPLKVVADIAGYKTSPIKKVANEKAEDGFDLYVTVSKGDVQFNVIIGSNIFSSITMAGNAFVLKGTEASGNPVVMIPLGVAKDFFGLDIEVKRPVGRGVYDYCSLAINFSGDKVSTGADSVIDVPNGDDGADRPDIDESEIVDGRYFVSTANNYYHSYDCKLINKSYSSLTEYECLFWGYEKCPVCLLKEDSHQDTNQSAN